jgi:hypothetical protein
MPGCQRRQPRISPESSFSSFHPPKITQTRIFPYCQFGSFSGTAGAGIMVNIAMAKLLALRNEDMPARLKTARPPTFSLILQGLGILFWVLLCVMFWLGVAQLVF